jgi:hypothetical protein
VKHSISLQLPCNEALERLTEALTGVGFQVERSFDLQSARSSMRVPEACPCPDHGTVNCSCQYVVLIINRHEAAPLSVVAHGQENRTHLSLDSSAAAAGIDELVHDLIVSLVAVE